jgi:methylated-DNA-[protein]-cysteine S-methyltransferase
MRMSEAHELILDTPLGKLGVVLDGSAVTRMDFLPAHTRDRPARSAGARHVARILRSYFRCAGPLADELPLCLQGTAFQQRVWQALRAIPCGEVRTYGELAARLGSGARAVGNACRHNPVPVIVPCHRVVGAAGIGGYAGRTAGRELERKRWLLRHEGVIKS